MIIKDKDEIDLGILERMMTRILETAFAVTIHQTTTVMHPDKRLLCSWSIKTFHVYGEPRFAMAMGESIQSSI